MTDSQTTRRNTIQAPAGTTRPHPPARGHRHLRAMRSEDPEALIAARADALRPFLGATSEARLAAIRRLLRAERRAARSGVGYDAVRHAALHRLMSESERQPRC